jgi:2-furoate---CoA ligase
VNLGRTLAWTAERYPDRPAIGGERSFTYAEWDVRTNRLARGLAGLGARRGERVALVMANGERLAAAHLAAQKLGACSTPLNTRFSAEELAYCIEDAGPAVLVSDDAIGELLDEALAKLDDAAKGFEHLRERDFEKLIESADSDAAPGVEVSEDDPSVMLYTSGTTGQPKGVPRSHRAEWSAGVAHVVQARYAAGESTLGAMPMYHTMGLRSLVSMLVVGGKFVAMPAFKPEPALELIEREEISSLYLVPTAFWALTREGGLGEAAASVTKLAYAGAAMTSSLCEELVETLRPEVFVNHYGSTEVYTFTVEEDAAARPASAGRPGLFTRVRLVRADADERVGPDDEIEPGETGEVIASLDSEEAFAGYWQRPDADEKALRDGWYFTGDLGVVGDDGRFQVAGRVDDMIITGGENVHPLEVEDALGHCPSVAEVAVAGVEHERWGQEVTAFVVGEGEADPDEIDAWVRSESGLSPYKRPKRVVIVSEIPKSPVGKILRRKLTAGEYEAL